MFDKSIDEKPLFIDEYGVETTDIGESFLNPDGAEVELYSVYKVPDDMEMRPDKVSLSMYGTDKYTEIVCAYNDFRNPFTIQKDDVINLVSLTSVYNNVYEPSYDTDSSARTKNNGALLSRYVDRSKAPDTAGSQRNTAVVSKSRRISAAGKRAAAVLPPNMAGIGVPAVEIKDGRVYFGANAANYSSKGNSSSRTANSLSSITVTYNGNEGRSAAAPSGRRTSYPASGSTAGNLSDVTADIISGEYGQDAAARTADEIISDINVADMTVDLMRAAASGAGSQAYADTVKSLRDAGMSDGYINDVINTVSGPGTSGGGASGLSGSAARKLAAAGMTPAALRNIANQKAADKSSVVSPNSGMIGGSGVESKNGRVYFGSDTSVGCADNGMSAGDYMTDSIKNKIKG